MTAHRPPRRAPRPVRERGQAMLLTVLLLGVGMSAVIYNFVTPARQAVERDKITIAALAQAREALIGYAAADNRPGSLPCPDLVTNNPVINNVPNDGSADQFTGSDCAGYVSGNAYVGRLPWRTLRLPDLRDGYGERLWYAVSRDFARSSACTPPTCPAVNSDLAGQLTISGVATAVIAIVFSPGQVLGNQVRNTANENTVANYLEGGNEIGATTSIFVTGQTTPAFNDKLLPITRDAFFPVVEMRVARELRLSLSEYFTGPDPTGAPRRYYPFASQFPANTPNPATPSSPGTYSGYLPSDSVGCSVFPDLTAFLPPWFITNLWQQVVVYAVAPQCTPRFNVDSQLLAAWEPTPPCAVACPPPSSVPRTCEVIVSVDTTASNCNNTTAGGLLTVGSTTTVRAIVMPSGNRLGTQARPCGAVTDCLEVVAGSNENINGDTVYVRPVRSVTNNDSLVVVDPSP